MENVLLKINYSVSSISPQKVRREDACGKKIHSRPYTGYFQRGGGQLGEKFFGTVLALVNRKKPFYTLKELLSHEKKTCEKFNKLFL